MITGSIWDAYSLGYSVLNKYNLFFIVNKQKLTKRRPQADPSLGDLIREVATDSGLSVNKIAQETGLDQSTLNKFLNGTRDNIRLDSADRLFRFFGLRALPPRAKYRKRVSRDD